MDGDSTTFMSMYLMTLNTFKHKHTHTLSPINTRSLSHTHSLSQTHIDYLSHKHTFSLSLSLTLFLSQQHTLSFCLYNRTDAQSSSPSLSIFKYSLTHTCTFWEQLKYTAWEKDGFKFIQRVKTRIIQPLWFSAENMFTAINNLISHTWRWWWLSECCHLQRSRE